MVVSIVFSVALGAALGLVGLSLLTFLKPDFQFWPPPNAESWQYATFRGLFRVFFGGLVALSVMTFDTTGPAWRYAFGIPLVVIGFGFALHWTNFLGWRNAFGEARGLKTNGAYRWSRNPIYVVSVVGMIGWGIVVASWWVASLLLLWALLYIVAPILEEPWLEQQYGDAFLSYKSRVHRFFGCL